jgi:hypothetical protein
VQALERRNIICDFQSNRVKKKTESIIKPIEDREKEKRRKNEKRRMLGRNKSNSIMNIILFIKLGMAKHTCNPSYSRQRQGDHEFKASMGTVS